MSRGGDRYGDGLPRGGIRPFGAAPVICEDTVARMFTGCLLRDSEPDTAAVAVQGVLQRAVFSVESIACVRHVVKRFLAELPEPFHERREGFGCGGWLFANGCFDWQDERWGGCEALDELICLGIACGYVRLLPPPQPGRLPLFVISKEVTL